MLGCGAGCGRGGCSAMRGGGSGCGRRVGEEHVRLPIDGLEARRLALAGCRHLLGQIENVIRVRRSLVRRRIEPRQHRIDVVLFHARLAAARPAATAGTRMARRHRAGRGGSAPARRRRRLGGGRLGGIVVGDDAANGGEDFLHRRLLRLRRLAHCRIPTVPIRNPRTTPGPDAAANHPTHSIFTRIVASMARRICERQRSLVDTHMSRASRREPGDYSA